MEVQPYTMLPADQLRATVPMELQQIDQWVTWTLKKRENKAKLDKVPRNAHTGHFASSTDPDTWATFDVAVEAAVTRGHNGVGFVLAEGTPIVGIDLDSCIDPATGMIEAWAADIVQVFNSYTEVSPSGTGLRIFVQGTKHTTECRKDNIEIYNWGRFLTVTGNKLEDAPGTVKERQKKIDLFTQWLFGANEEPGTEPESTDLGTPISRNGKHADTLITTAFRISPTAEPPFKKWATLCRTQPRVQAIFNHTRVAEYGGNMSKIEQALANYAVAAGWTDQEVVDLIIAHRVTYGEAPKHLAYYQHTITTAHDDNGRRTLLEGFTALINPTKGTDTGPPPNGQTDANEGAMQADEEGVDTEDTERAEPDQLLGPNGKLSLILSHSESSIRIDKILMYNTEPPSFRMLTDRGEIYFPAVEKLIHQGFLKLQLANRRHIIPTISKHDWPKVQQWLVDACELVDAGEDATEYGQVRAWLQAYFAEHRVKPDFEAAVSTMLPFKMENQIGVFGSDLRQFIGSALHEYITAHLFGAKMRSFGALPKTMLYSKPGGGRTSYHVWLLPPEYTP